MTPPRHPGSVGAVEEGASRRSGGRSEVVLRRHLEARVDAARRELAAIERSQDVPDELSARFGDRVLEAQRLLEAERAAADARDVEVMHVAEVAGEALVDAAEREARVLRAVASWLRQGPLAHVGERDRPTEVVEGGVGSHPRLVSFEARAS